jgi:diguanylate cyclase (GGDEF)-like protein
VLNGLPAKSPHIARLLPIFANVCALGIKNAQLFRRIDEMARRDGLTGLWNRAEFNAALDRLTRQAHEQQRSLCVVMSDVDHFKKFNDAFGHQAGDHVLREVAKLWKASLPDFAVVARYGGEEFIAILPDTDLVRARDLSETLQAELQAFPLVFEGQDLHVTASFGIAELSSPAAEPTELVHLADEALYAAKKSGRNRVCIHEAAHVLPSTDPVAVTIAR